MIAWLHLAGLAWAGASLDLTLERAEAARDVGRWPEAASLASEALELDPADPRCHYAWQTALVGGRKAWRLDAEYAWLLDGQDPWLSELAEAWLSASGQPWVAIRLRDQDEELAAELRLYLAARQGSPALIRKSSLEVQARWPDRPDLLEGMLHDESMRTASVRRAALKAAIKLATSEDLLSLYRAHEAFVALGEQERAAKVAARLAAAGEPFPLVPHRTWNGGMLKDMGQLMALQEQPSLPGSHEPHEQQWALAYAAGALEDKGRYELAAETWRRALAADEPSPTLLLKASEGIERGGGGPEEVLALSERAAEGLALEGRKIPLARALLVQARSLRKLERNPEALMAATLAAGLGVPEALVLRGELLEMEGERELAFEAYAQAAALGVHGLEPRLERLYRGPATWQAVVAAWPLEQGQRAVDAPAPFPRSSLGEVTLGQGPVVVNFWASWCAPCQEELPELELLAATGVTVVAVSIDSAPQDMERFLEDQSLHHVTVIWDPGLARELEVSGVPTTLIVDSTGLVVHRTQGYRTGDVGRLAHEVQKLE